jgi:hypothetical protein
MRRNALISFKQMCHAVGAPGKRQEGHLRVYDDTRALNILQACLDYLGGTDMPGFGRCSA